MRLLVVEDEPLIAEYLVDMCRQILKTKIRNVHIANDCESAHEWLHEHVVDLCFLDLNLNGENGFSLLQSAVANSFQTIIVSAYADQAITAFEFGVLDFIAKPFTEDRLRKAIDRFTDNQSRSHTNPRVLPVRVDEKIKLIEIKKISYIKAADDYVQVFYHSRGSELVDKPLYRLQQILPEEFIRIHRSYIVNRNEILAFGHDKNGTYFVELENKRLPLSRTRYKFLRNLLS